MALNCTMEEIMMLEEPSKYDADTDANGSKICVVYNGEPYMLKFPVPPSRNKELSYTNGCASEYIGYHMTPLSGIKINGKKINYHDFIAP